MKLPERKSPRLKEYDYSVPGAYFVTICTKERQELLSQIIVGTGVLDCPQNKLTYYGEIANDRLIKMSDFYENIKIEKFIVMPNHIHMIIQIFENGIPNGTSGTPSPTNSVISKFVSTFKRLTNKEYGANIWQRSFHDHIIRGKEDYNKIWQYIDTNVLRWEMDCFHKTYINNRN